MNHVRVLSSKGTTKTPSFGNYLYEEIIKDLEQLKSSFFKTEIEFLLKGVSEFFVEQEDCPFPVVAHVMPPFDCSDSVEFVEALKTIDGVEFIDHEIYHIHHKRVILFHSSPPPSDIPRIFSFFQCFFGKYIS